MSFKNIGYLEALSFLVLLFVAMPLKYLMGMPLAVRIVGSLHGLFFILYVVKAYLLSQDESWPKRKLAESFVAAVIPFGPFIFHKRYAI